MRVFETKQKFDTPKWKTLKFRGIFAWIFMELSEITKKKKKKLAFLLKFGLKGGSGQD